MKEKGWTVLLCAACVLFLALGCAHVELRPGTGVCARICNGDERAGGRSVFAVHDEEEGRCYCSPPNDPSGWWLPDAPPATPKPLALHE